MSSTIYLGNMEKAVSKLNANRQSAKVNRSRSMKDKEHPTSPWIRFITHIFMHTYNSTVVLDIGHRNRVRYDTDERKKTNVGYRISTSESSPMR